MKTFNDTCVRILVYFVSHLHKGLEPLVVLLQLLEEADGVVVVAAELPVHRLHPLRVLLCELERRKLSLIMWQAFSSGNSLFRCHALNGSLRVTCSLSCNGPPNRTCSLT